MKIKLVTLLIFAVMLSSCDQSKTNKEDVSKDIKILEKKLVKVTEEQFDIKNDSLIFDSATIENFDKDGNSIDVYWIGEKQDTVLSFYRKYDESMKLIGAEYFEEGDTEPNRDTVYTNKYGLRVEASLNSENKIRWKSTIHEDSNGNEVLKTYENGKGEYRGYDSLYFDSKNRVTKGFYENSNGKRYGIKTYIYLKSDQNNNWIERQMFVNDTLKQKHIRKLEY